METKINESISGNVPQAKESALATPSTRRPSRKKRGTEGPGLSKILQITKKRRKSTEGDEREVKSTDSILEIMKLNMISKRVVESNQEARRLEDRVKEEKKLEREKAKEEAKEERLRIAE